MLELPFLREKKDEAIARLSKRNIDAAGLVGRALELDEQRRALQAEADAKQAEMNELSRSIGELMKGGKKAEAEAAKAKSTDLKASIAALKEKQEAAEKAQHDHLCTIPNAPNAKVPIERHRRRTPWCCKKAPCLNWPLMPSRIGNSARNTSSSAWTLV